MHNFKSHFWQDFLACCTSQSAFGDGVCWLLIRQFFSLFAQMKTTTKSHEKCVFLYPFSNTAISPQNNQKTVFYTGKLYGLTGMQLPSSISVPDIVIKLTIFAEKLILTLSLSWHMTPLTSFAPVSEDFIHKLISQSQSERCSVNPVPCAF